MMDAGDLCTGGLGVPVKGPEFAAGALAANSLTTKAVCPTQNTGGGPIIQATFSPSCHHFSQVLDACPDVECVDTVNLRRAMWAILGFCLHLPAAATRIREPHHGHSPSMEVAVVIQQSPF